MWAARELCAGDLGDLTCGTERWVLPSGGPVPCGNQEPDGNLNNHVKWRLPRKGDGLTLSFSDLRTSRSTSRIVEAR